MAKGAAISVLLSLAVLIPFISAECTIEEAKPLFRDSVYEFSTELTSKIASNSKNHFIFCPFSIWTLISGISEGADGATLSEIQRVLRHNKDKCLNSKYYEIVFKGGEPIRGSTLERSGALIFDEKLPIKEEFKTKFYSIGLGDVLTPSFANLKETATVINNYVKNATHGGIDDVVTEASLENIKLVMIDAIYFKGSWKLPFTTEETEVMPFFSDSGESLGQVNMMHRSDIYGLVILEKLQASVLELPYLSGKFSMLIFLPQKDVKLTTVIGSLKETSIKTILELTSQKRSNRVVDVQLPRFKIESNFDNMVEILNEIGLKDMFQSTARFPRMADVPLFVEKFIQKADVEVTEKGTIARAVSVAESASRSLPRTFNVNKPFLFMIVDKKYEIPMFTGAYSNPSLF